MTRRDVGIAVVIGAIAGVNLAFYGFGTASLPAFALSYWYVGVALLVIGAVFARRRLSVKVARILGSIGAGWVAMIVIYPIVFITFYILSSPHGP